MTNSETVSVERLRDMLGLGCDDIARHEAVSMAAELLALRAQPAQSVNEPGEWDDKWLGDGPTVHVTATAASIPAEAQGREVAVKPLEWEDSGEGEWTAETIFGSYYLPLQSGDVFDVLARLPEYQTCLAERVGEEEAKAICEAHNSQLILSALAAAPQSTPPAPERSKEEVGAAFPVELVDFIWEQLCEEDRSSPEDQPDMALVCRNDLLVYAELWNERATEKPALEPASLHKGDEPDAYVDWSSQCVYMAENIKDPSGLQPVWFASPAPLPVTLTDEMVEAIGAAAYGRHERGFVMWPLMGGDEIKDNIRVVLAALSVKPSGEEG